MATRYKLDLDIVDEIYAKYSEEPLKKKLDKDRDNNLISFELLRDRLFKLIEKSGISSINNFIAIQQRKPKLELRQNGVPMKALVKIKPEDFVDGKLTDEYIQKLKFHYDKYLEQYYSELTRNKQTIEKLLDDANSMKYPHTL